MFPFKLLALLPLFTPLTAAQCNSDNCLRALRGHTSSAIPFCATYTLTTSAPIATWVASPCQTNPSRVSSACNCAVTAPPTPVVATTDNVKYSPPWEAYNVRSDPVGGYTYEERFQECMWHCYTETGYCQMFSFGIMEASAGLGAYYLCARYEEPYDAQYLVSTPNIDDYTVWARA